MFDFTYQGQDFLVVYDPQNVCEMVEQALSFSACYAWIVRLDEPDRAPRGQELWHLEGIARTLRAVGVELLDFILMGREDFYSMNVHGGMEVLRRESADLALHERYASD